MLGHGMGPFNEYVGQPMPMTAFRASTILHQAISSAKSSMVRFLIGDALSGLTTTICPWCVPYRVVQMPHESVKIPE